MKRAVEKWKIVKKEENVRPSEVLNFCPNLAGLFTTEVRFAPLFPTSNIVILWMVVIVFRQAFFSKTDFLDG